MKKQTNKQSACGLELIGGCHSVNSALYGPRKPRRATLPSVINTWSAMLTWDGPWLWRVEEEMRGKDLTGWILNLPYPSTYWCGGVTLGKWPPFSKRQSSLFKTGVMLCFFTLPSKLNKILEVMLSAHRR